MDSALENGVELYLAFGEQSVFIVFTQTQGKLNEQLRIVLKENAALQKQLIKLERQYLKSMMKHSPITQIKGGRKCQLETHTSEYFAVCLTHTLCVFRGSDRSGGAEERGRGAEGESAGG